MTRRPNGTRVIKIGGEVALDARAVDDLLQSIVSNDAAQDTVLVHGGGALASSMAERYGQPPRTVAGRRITSELDLRTILWSVCGEVNTRLVAAAGARGIPAVGLSGADAQMIIATRRPPREIDGETVDFGFVGDILGVDPGPIRVLLANGYLPIVATLGVDAAGTLLNINADTVASRLATALDAESLFLVTPSGGLRRSQNDPGTAIRSCTRANFEEGVAEGWISGGMRVKLEEAFRCLDSGVRRVMVTTVSGLSDDTGTRLEP